jgi:hypothetical protein
MPGEKQIHILYVIQGEFTETVHFIKAFSDKSEAEATLKKLKARKDQIDARFQKWFSVERRGALDRRPSGESIWECLKRVELTSPAREWDLKDVEGNAVCFQSSFYLQTLQIT